MGLSISATKDTLNRYAVKYNKGILQALRQGLEFENQLTPKACDHTHSAPNVTQSELLQSYQWEYTPKGTTNFDAVENTLQKIKIDLFWTADDLDDFWNSWMVEWFEVGKNPKDWTFHKYLYEEVMMPKILEEMNHNAWHGTYVAPTPGTAGLSINAVDGYAKKIADAILAGDLTPYATGAFVANTMVDQIESWCDSLPLPYRDKPGVIRMSPTNAKNYWRNYRANFGTGNGVDNNGNTDLRIDATNKQIVSVDGMEGSNRIIFFPKQTKNLVWGTRKGFPTYPKMRWEYTERTIKGLTEFYRFYGVLYWEHLFVNDQV